MNEFKRVLKTHYDANLNDAFQKAAVYYPGMDFLEYVAVDAVTVSDRIDEFLTLVWNRDQTEVVGFKLKGFRYFFENELKPELQEQDFIPLVKAIEKIFTRIGAELINAKNPPKQLDGYLKAKELAVKDNVVLSNQALAA